ncbi:MAG: hypothetical protein HOQ05_02940 [Corynebacteriales bacterium]|nr:hypothetical protein [Mycobacteriales bacterium]
MTSLHPPRSSVLGHVPETASNTALHNWLAEHDRTLMQLRNRISELEHSSELERDLSLPNAIAAAGLFSMPLALCLPWITGTERGSQAVSGWMLLFAPVSGIADALALYGVVGALMVQALALLFRSHWSAMLATAASAIASLATMGVLFAAARDSSSNAGAGPLVGVVVFLILSVAWATITELRRFT